MQELTVEDHLVHYKVVSYQLFSAHVLKPFVILVLSLNHTRTGGVTALSPRYTFVPH